MKRYLALILGLVVLAVIASQADLAEVWAAMRGIGLLGIAAVLAVFFAAFVIDSGSWQLMLPSAGLNGVWLWRVTKVRLVGEALNLVVPAGTLGGEPAKAWLLKHLHGIGYRESAASLIMAKTVNLLALVGFCALGLILIWREPRLSDAFRMTLAAGLGALTLGVLGFYAVQHGRAASRLARFFARWRFAAALERFLEHIHDVDDRFGAFYVAQRGRFALALALALANWALNMAELYAILWFLGQPITWAEALAIETAAQLVRAGTFFIPGSLGASEAVMVAIFDALSGRPALGLAVALIRRGREAVWVAWGLGLGWLYSLTPAKIPALAAERSSDRDDGGPGKAATGERKNI